ncbi:hypothetical protein D3C85_1466880 [compost metagenome]
MAKDLPEPDSPNSTPRLAFGKKPFTSHLRFDSWAAKSSSDVILNFPPTGIGKTSNSSAEAVSNPVSPPASRIIFKTVPMVVYSAVVLIPKESQRALPNSMPPYLGECADQSSHRSNPSP